MTAQTSSLQSAAPSAPPEYRHTPIRVRHLSRAFGGKTVLDNLSIDIAPGEFVALIGKSGSGKSTFLRALASLDDDAEGAGEIQVPEHISVLFQDSRLLPWDRVIDNVTLGVRGPDALAKARAVLAAVGLGNHEQAWPSTLSGGEQQRAALARSLVRSPALLLADEPFGALDALTRIKMHELLFQLVALHKPTVLLVTHDVNEALVLADRVLVMEEGRFCLDVQVDQAHPRDPSAPRFDALRRQLLDALGVVIHV